MDLLEKNVQNINRHPWEIARMQSILKVLKITNKDVSFADIGSGDQYFTKELLKITTRPVYSVDINFPTTKQSDQIIECRDLALIPDRSIDYIFLLDVLEHVDDDSVFLKKVFKLLKNDGIIIITVPAHQFLFSKHDVFLKHFRRYNKSSISSLLIQNDFEHIEMFYFFTILFVIRLVQVILNKLKTSKSESKGIGSWKFRENNLITICLTKFLMLDFIMMRKFNKIGINLTGLSLCVICRKKSV